MRCWARFFAWVLSLALFAAFMPTMSSGIEPAAAIDTNVIATMISISVKPLASPAVRRRARSSHRDTARQPFDVDCVGLAGPGDLEAAGERGPAGVEVGAMVGAARAGGRLARHRLLRRREGDGAQGDRRVVHLEWPRGLVGRDGAVGLVDGPGRRGEVDAVGPTLR